MANNDAFSDGSFMQKGGGSTVNKNAFDDIASSTGSYMGKANNAIPADMQSETSYMGRGGGGAIPADMMSDTSYIRKAPNADMQSEVSYMAKGVDNSHNVFDG